MKKKIGVFLAGRPQDGGKFQYNLAILDAVAALPQESYEVVVGFLEDLWISYLDDYDLFSFQVQPGFWGRALFKVWRRLGLPIKWWRAVNPWFHPVARQLLQRRCDLWIFPAEDTWTYQIKVPALATIQDLMHRYERRFPEVLARGEYEWRENEYRNINRWATGILVDSEVGKKQFAESYGHDTRSIYVLPFVAPRYILASDQAKTDLDHYGLPDKFIFYPAQFWEHKNHKSLIRAAAILKPQYPDIHLAFAGSEKNAYASVRELVRDLGLEENVHFLGYVPNSEMAELYRRARALFMPTFFGPTDIPALEAIALGCPVAISDVYGMREQMGDAALFFNPASVPEIAQVMERLWQDDALCRDMAQRGLVRAAQWTQRHFNARLQDIIDAMLLAS